MPTQRTSTILQVSLSGLLVAGMLGIVLGPCLNPEWARTDKASKMSAHKPQVRPPGPSALDAARVPIGSEDRVRTAYAEVDRAELLLLEAEEALQRWERFTPGISPGREPLRVLQLRDSQQLTGQVIEITQESVQLRNLDEEIVEFSLVELSGDDRRKLRREYGDYLELQQLWQAKYRELQIAVDQARGAVAKAAEAVEQLH